MMTHRAAFAIVISSLGGAIACGGTPSPVTLPAPVATATTVTVRPLPPVQPVDGPLDVKVVYPTPNQVLTSKDSNFIFGSIGSGVGTLTINGVPARVYPNGSFIAFMANPPASSPRYELVATKGAETARGTREVRYPHTPAARAAVAAGATLAGEGGKPENLATSRADTIAALHARIDSLRARLTRDEPIGWVQLGQPSAGTDTDRVIVGRPIPGGTYKWFFTPGTVAPLVAREGGWARVRLDRMLDVYVDSSDAIALPATATAPNRVASNMRVRGSTDGVELSIPLGARAPYFVEEGEHSIAITLYGVHANTDLVNYAAGDSLVRTVEWSQETADRAKVTVHLRNAPYGYLVLWEGNALVLKIRGRPVIDANRPLAGLTIVVDPGHPPIGATGPTGLWEPQATLPVGMRLKTLLEERGARVIMTRTTADPVALGDRPVIARRANANAFVSIHYNAYPDGVNPFKAPGTGTYFFRSHSEPLARAVQRTLVPQMGLQDLGINYDNLAVVRATWYPAILTEGAFIMIPDQEAAMRTPEYQDRYARGIADGLENFFRALPSR